MPFIIYLLSNTIDGKRYVGQSMHSLENRWKQHKRPSSGCHYLRNAILKHGEENFTREVIKEGIETQAEADAWEISYIKELGTRRKKVNGVWGGGYNLTDGGAGVRDTEQWIKTYAQVVAFCELHGHNPRNRAELEEERRLAEWMNTQRTIGREDMNEDRVLILEQPHDCSRWVWDQHRADFEEQGENLRRVLLEIARWPKQGSSDPHEKKAATFMSNLRRAGKENSPQYKLDGIESIANGTGFRFEWDAVQAKWLETLDTYKVFLRTFARRPKRWGPTQEERSLGEWEKKQRTKGRSDMQADRVEMLERIDERGIVWEWQLNDNKRKRGVDDSLTE